MATILYYVHDPMCSWCWAFRPARTAFFDALPAEVTVQRLLGGLAPDTDEPMPRPLQQKISGIWRSIQHTVPGTEFNFDFWTNCRPRRATYPACRAVVAARSQAPDSETTMIAAIQEAYYLQARNPSESDTLIEVAEEIGLNADQFATDLIDPATQQTLLQEIDFARRIGVFSFPSLVVQTAAGYYRLPHDYQQPDNMLRQLDAILAAGPSV